jgi:rubrerythrin
MLPAAYAKEDHMSQTQTEENLYTAFVGEAKASLRLLGYAEQAEKEGYTQMARLFRAISAAERIHALKHLRQLKVIKTTEENLKSSFESESTVSENVYPDFIRIAEEEGAIAARIGFTHARDAEMFHAKLYKNAIDHMIEEKETTYQVCTVCGYVVDGTPPDECPVCGAKKDMFFQVE